MILLMLFLLVAAFLIFLFLLMFLEVDSNLIHAGRASLHVNAFVLITEGTLLFPVALKLFFYLQVYILFALEYEHVEIFI